MVRALRLPAFAASLVVLVLVVLSLPDQVPVLFREVSADPWTVLCVVPAMALPYTLNPGHEALLSSLPTPLATLRGVGIAACLAMTTLTIGITGLLDGHDPAVGVRNALLAIALCLLLSLWLPGELVSMMLFVAASAVWIFGRETLGGEVEPWAVLLLPSNGLQVMVTLGFSLLAAWLWIRRGSMVTTDA